MPKLSSLNYNYRVIKHEKKDDQYVKVYDKLFSQLKDIKNAFPDFKMSDIQYLARHNSVCRIGDKYKGLSIQKIFPIKIY
jgi:hypothetical protein